MFCQETNRPSRAPTRQPSCNPATFPEHRREPKYHWLKPASPPPDSAQEHRQPSRSTLLKSYLSETGSSSLAVACPIPRCPPWPERCVRDVCRLRATGIGSSEQPSFSPATSL